VSNPGKKTMNKPELEANDQKAETGVGTTRLLACPSCGFAHPKLMKKERRRRDMDAKIWRDASEFSVKCPMCLMQSGPVEMDSVWPVKCWNTRKQANVEPSDRRMSRQ
jgi:hypothetical protein